MDIRLMSPAMAPMAGATDLAFRFMTRRFGCKLAFTEMVSANALIFENPVTLSILETAIEDHPVGVQLFGGDPEVMSKATAIVSEMPFDIIDINMGCPAPKIVKNSYGAALMREPDRARDIILSVVGSTKKPVTVKIRKGWDDESVNAVQIAVIAEACGAAAITVHGRTRTQFYSGKADWDIIRRVKQAVSIPVFGNGDVFSAEDAARMLDETGCDGVAVGRGALGNPWIFEHICSYLKNGRL
jgi:tRNA-dihydrouridine synthase B